MLPIMTCDGLSDVIDEFKFTRAKKMATERFLDPRVNWLKLQQGMGYCIGYGDDTVRWHVLSAFEWPDPIYTKYLVKFSHQELEATRRMIENI